MPADPSTLDLPALTAEAKRLGYVRRGAPGVVRWADGECTLASWHDGDCAAMWWEVRGGVALATEAAALRWLLDQPKARRLAAIVDAAEARGREAERAEVAALRADLHLLREDLMRASVALEKARNEGREAERADVVAWLRREAEIFGSMTADDPTLAHGCRKIAAAAHVGAVDRARR